MSYATQLQKIWRDYERAGMPMPASARQVAEWAIERGKWQQRPEDVVSRCAEELARAAREEYRTDETGRRYRAKHALRIKQGATQISIWADIDTAARPYMEKAFAQRRQQIVGDCHQLRVDVDHFNDAHPKEDPIQIVLDFTDDVEEVISFESRRERVA